MKTYLLAVLIFFSLTTSSIALELPTFPFVIADTKSTIDVKPDIAKINFKVMAFDKISENATLKVEKTVQSIIAILNSRKIDLKNLEASDYQKTIIRKRNNNFQELEIEGYELSRDISIDLRDITIYATIMKSLVNIDNTTKFSTNFDVHNREEIKAELFMKACSKANKKATNMANAFDAKIISIYAISEGQDFDRYWAQFGVSGYGRDGHGVGGGGMNNNDISFFVPESITIEKYVKAVFKIKNN